MKLIDPGCGECLCRVCARNECSDNYSKDCDQDCLGCNGCKGPVDTEEDCPREEFIPDDSDAEMDYRDYGEKYEPTYNPEDGSM